MSEQSKTSHRSFPYTKTIIFVVLAIAVVFVLLLNRKEALQVLATLHQGEPRWLAIAVGLQCVFFVLYAMLYQTAFGAVDVPARTRHFIPLWFVSVFVNTVASPFGFTVFIDDAVHRGFSGAKAAVGVLLVRAVDIVTFVLLLLIGFATLYFHHMLRPFHLAAAGVLLLLVMAWLVVILLALHFPTRLLGLLSFIERLGQKTPLRAKFATGWAEQTTTELIGGIRPLLAEPKRLILPFMVAAIAHAVDILSLAALFPAFHQGVALDVVLSGFGVGVLFWIVSLTPEGMGTVEGMMALTFIGQGIAAPRATAVALAFRGLTYYLPLLLGLLFVRFVFRRPLSRPIDANILQLG